jgi:hypothetical protein
MSMSEEIKIIAFTFFKSIEIGGKYYERIGEAKLETFGHGIKNLKYLFHYLRLLKFALQPERPFMNEEIPPVINTQEKI